MTHICVGKLTIIGSDNGLSPGRRQAIIWTNSGILLIGPLGTNFRNFNRNSNIFIQENALENVVCEMSSILSRSQCVNWHPDGCIIGKFYFYTLPMNVFVIGHSLRIIDWICSWGKLGIRFTRERVSCFVTGCYCSDWYRRLTVSNLYDCTFFVKLSLLTWFVSLI